MVGALKDHFTLNYFKIMRIFGFYRKDLKFSLAFEEHRPLYLFIRRLLYYYLMSLGPTHEFLKKLRGQKEKIVKLRQRREAPPPDPLVRGEPF